MTMSLLVPKRFLVQFLVSTTTVLTMSRALVVTRRCRHCNLNHNRLPTRSSLESSATRLFSSVALQKHVQQHNDDGEGQSNNQLGIPTETLLHPADFLTPEGTFPVLKSLSPSSILEFQKCPQSFFLQYILKLRQPTSKILCKGTMVHAALEKVFELDAPDRTLENLQNLLRKEWSSKRLSDDYKFLFENDNGGRNLEAEREWGTEALNLLQNYYQVEDPRAISKPEQREVWVVAPLAKDATQGVTAGAGGKKRWLGNEGTFQVRGIIDRMDIVRGRDNHQPYLRLTDYKTGKAPNLKYAPYMNDKIRHESFYQLFIYALLLREKQKAVGVDLRFLRLFYMTSVTGQAELLEYDLGATRAERDAKLHHIHKDLAKVWEDITSQLKVEGAEAARLWKPCTREFCYCHKCREKFVPGTLEEPA
mmetsp:Transcript_29294/g.80486  ORF Transcript_29294/g.80486 Transcript_29294/m.80486 type:complete len:421 (-) Transcript_29294:5019-6281(-)